MHTARPQDLAFPARMPKERSGHIRSQKANEGLIEVPGVTQACLVALATSGIATPSDQVDEESLAAVLGISAPREKDAAEVMDLYLLALASF